MAISSERLKFIEAKSVVENVNMYGTKRFIKGRRRLRRFKNKKNEKFKMNTLPFRVFPLLGMFSYFNSLAPLERKKNYACKIKSTTYFLRTRFS